MCEWIGSDVNLKRVSGVDRWQPRVFPRAVVLVILAVLTVAASEAAPTAGALAGLAAMDRVRIVDPPRDVGDFELIDQDGNARRLSDFRGRPLLIFFGFTHCPDVCPTTLAGLRAMLRDKAVELRDTRVVLISVDGERDRPDVLKAFLAQFSKDFIGLTGDPATLRQVAARFPAVFFKEAPDVAGNYTVAHSAQVFLVDRWGRLRAEFMNAPPESVAVVTALVAGEVP
jgi:protein SCO1/2